MHEENTINCLQALVSLAENHEDDLKLKKFNYMQELIRCLKADTIPDIANVKFTSKFTNFLSKELSFWKMLV